MKTFSTRLIALLFVGLAFLWTSAGAYASLYDLVRMTTPTTGATNVVALGVALPGFLSFSQANVPDGSTVSIAIGDTGASPAQNLAGYGVYSAGAQTVTITQITASTNAGAMIPLSGSAQIAISPNSHDLETVDAGGATTISNGVPGEILIDNAGHVGVAASAPNIDAGGATTISNGTNGNLLEEVGGRLAPSGIAASNLATLGANIFTGTQTINPPSGTTNQGIAINQTGPASSVPVRSPIYNMITVNDQSDDTTSSDIIAGHFLDFTEASTTPAAVANVWADRVDVNVNSAIEMGDMIALVPRCVMSAANTGSGGCYGANPQGILLSGGSASEVAGMECDSRIDNGASALWHFGCGAVMTGSENGTALDGAYEIGAVETGWNVGLLFNSLHGHAALSSSGCAVCTDGSSATVATGIDLSTWTITGDFLKGPNGFAITGAGGVQILGSPGLSCTGTPSSSFTTANGIVVHC